MIKNIARNQSRRISKGRAIPKVFAIFMLGSMVFASCKKQDSVEPQAEVKQATTSKIMTNDEEFRVKYTGLSWQTLWELQQARSATAQYQDINNAFRDGYADIHVVEANMGYHFMKADNLDANFDPRKPELLVYNKDEAGNFQLLAVEYAIPISFSPDAPPAGFTGDNDVWDHNDEFGLWTCHAWVWKFNPDGVFNPTNPLVTVR